MTLEYWREYRTYFHLGNSWGVNESTAYRIVLNLIAGIYNYELRYRQKDIS
jgi:hypothetical protein